jgi:hypothetical protein
LSDLIDKRMEDESLEDELMDDEPIAPRPRGRLLRPLPLVLMAVTIAAAGFLGGVLAQKGSEGASGAGEFPGLAEAKGGAATGLPTGGEAGDSGSSAVTGTVTSVEGHTIYVKESAGTVVAVKAGDGSTVTRDSSVSAKKVHPGDTVVVEGSKRGSTVRASSISATESGVEATAGVAAPAGESAEGPSVESLFE